MIFPDAAQGGLTALILTHFAPIFVVMGIIVIGFRVPYRAWDGLPSPHLARAFRLCLALQQGSTLLPLLPGTIWYEWSLAACAAAGVEPAGKRAIWNRCDWERKLQPAGKHAKLQQNKHGSRGDSASIGHGETQW